MSTDMVDKVCIKKMRSSMYHVVNKIQVFNTKRVF